MNRVPNPLIDELAEDLVPVRPISIARGVALVTLAAIATVVAVELFHGLWRGAFSGQASGFFFIANGMLGLLGAASALAVLRMASPRVGNGHEGARWSAAMLGLLPVSTLLVLGFDGLASELTHDVEGFHCFLAGSGFSLLTAGALVLWLRSGAPVSIGSASLFTGIASGAIGSFAYGMACPIDTMGHLGIWHVAPVALCALVGKLVIPRLVRW